MSKKKQKIKEYTSFKERNNILELGNDFKPINIFINDMDILENKELTEKRIFTKSIWKIGTIS